MFFSLRRGLVVLQQRWEGATDSIHDGCFLHRLGAGQKTSGGVNLQWWFRNTRKWFLIVRSTYLVVLLMELVKRCDVGIHRDPSLWSFCILTVLASTQNLRHWVSACWEARSWSLGLAILHVVVVGWPRCFEPQFLCSRRRTPSRHVSTSNYSFQRIPLPKKNTASSNSLSLSWLQGVYIYFWVLGNWNDSQSRCTSLWIQDMDAGTSSCGRCPAGTWNNGSTSVCNQCPAGTWSSEDMEWKSGCMQVLEIATSTKTLVKGISHPKNQRMVVIGCSKPEVSFSTHRRLPQQKTRLGFGYRMALRHAIRSIDLPEGTKKVVGLNWDYGTLSSTGIPPERIHTHKIAKPISIARSIHSYIHFPGSSLPVHKRPVRKRLHYLLNTKVCQPCAAGATGLLGQYPTLGSCQLL